MRDEGFPADRLTRIVTAAEPIEERAGVLSWKRQIGREEYATNSDTHCIVEGRFSRMTETAINIAEQLVKHERGKLPASNPASMRALGSDNKYWNTLTSRKGRDSLDVKDRGTHTGDPRDLRGLCAARTAGSRGVRVSHL
jgi:hypothetical protein